jgi:hypothetical protein
MVLGGVHFADAGFCRQQVVNSCFSGVERGDGGKFLDIQQCEIVDYFNRTVSYCNKVFHRVAQ